MKRCLKGRGTKSTSGDWSLEQASVGKISGSGLYQERAIQHYDQVTPTLVEGEKDLCCDSTSHFL